MIVIIDCEGEPVQEFSAIYVDTVANDIIDVFHKHVRYPFKSDLDSYSRRHIHGLNRAFLSSNGLDSESDLIRAVHQWLRDHPYEAIYAHAPAKEARLLSLPSIKDVGLRPWKERSLCRSHQLVTAMKLYKIPVCNVKCNAHTAYVGYKAKHVNNFTDSDKVKKEFSFHCSLYDCVECAYFLFDIRFFRQ